MEDIENWQTKFEPCIYSDRLLNKLILLNKKVNQPIDLCEVKKAIYYAKKYHGSQMRQSGYPYYSHPIEVAYMVSDYIFRTDIIVTSILHDTIEDTELTEAMIGNIFGRVIASQVMDLTRIKENGHKISASETVKYLFEQKKYKMLVIKLFDRLHNMQTIGVKSPEKIKKIVQETAISFITLSMHLRRMMPAMAPVDNEIYRLCCQHLIEK